MARREWSASPILAGLALAGTLLAPSPGAAHPLGNFSISQYAAIRIAPDAVELRYLVDMAEIPTFQEIQETAIVPEPEHPSLRGYLPRKIDALKEGLRLEVDGRPVRLRATSPAVIFPPGAGGMPTMKLGVVFRAPLTGSAGPRELRYRDGNFPDRAGWKEIVAVAAPGVTLRHSSVPATDRSRELADYPTDLLNSPPQDLQARVVFTRETPPPTVAGVPAGPSPSGPAVTPADRAEPAAAMPGPPAEAPRSTPAEPVGPATGKAIDLQPNRQGTPRSALTDLVTTKELSLGVVAVALAVAAALGAFHALEPGHGKTVVAAYLVGSRGTAWHAVLLGLIVTASHTAGVYLLGAVTLYASRYIVPERLYPWLGVISGLGIAGLGFVLLLRRYAGHSHPHDHAHPHHHHHAAHAHEPGDAPADHHHPEAESSAVSASSLVALGVTGGIVPCPAALVVLLSALSLNRVGFGLLLIVAFSVGLAVVLIAIGVLMVSARRFMARFRAEGPLIQRWLPLASSAVITVVGVAIAAQALVSAGILQIRF